jgi:hypothetical protein
MPLEPGRELLQRPGEVSDLVFATGKPLQVESDGAGSYRIQYFAGPALQHESGSADLVVKAADADGSLLAASEILFNAPPLAQVDLTISAEARRLSSLTTAR